jgi:hypothetical protein
MFGFSGAVVHPPARRAASRQLNNIRDPFFIVRNIGIISSFGADQCTELNILVSLTNSIRYANDIQGTGTSCPESYRT